jgi:purine-binding chemotaxis protein CheW
MDQPGSEILIFEIDGRRYGLPAAQIRELVRVVTIVSLPRSRAFIEGIVNLRGQVVPVIDLRAQLGLSPREAVPSDHLIIAQASDRSVAIRVDRALELRSPDAASVDPVEGFCDGGKGAVGVASLPDGLIPILDLPHFLPAVDAADPGDRLLEEVHP